MTGDPYDAPGARRSWGACAPAAIVRLHEYRGAVPVPQISASEEVRHARSRDHRRAGRDAAGRRGHGRRGAGGEDRRGRLGGPGGWRGESVAALGGPGPLSGSGRTLDARGKIVVPGGIEPHAHINIPVPEMWAGKPDVMTQPPEAATRAAAFGGVTTVVDFAGDLDLTPSANAPRVPIAEHVERRRAVFRGHSYTDFAFHYILAGEVAPQAIGEIGEAIRPGVPSFKIFTTFRPIRVPYGHLWSIFAEVAKHGGIMAVHAEEDDVVTYMTQKLKREGRAQGYNLHLVHNNISEDLAFRHIIRLAQHTGTAVYFVHTTAKEGVAAVAEARRLGQP